MLSCSNNSCFDALDSIASAHVLGQECANRDVVTKTHNVLQVQYVVMGSGFRVLGFRV